MNYVDGSKLFEIPDDRNMIPDAEIYVFYLAPISGICPSYIEDDKSHRGSISKTTVLQLGDKFKVITYSNNCSTNQSIINWLDILINDKIGSEQQKFYRKYLDNAQEIIIPTMEKLLVPNILSGSGLEEWCVNCSGKSQYIKFYKRHWLNRKEKCNAGLHFSIDDCLSPQPIITFHVENQWYHNENLKSVVFSNGSFDWELGTYGSISKGMWQSFPFDKMTFNINDLGNFPEFLYRFQQLFYKEIEKIEKIVQYRNNNFPNLKKEGIK